MKQSLHHAPSTGRLPYEKCETKLQQDVINAYFRTLRLTWTKVFKEDHLEAWNVVTEKQRKNVICHNVEVFKRKVNTSKRERITK